MNRTICFNNSLSHTLQPPLELDPRKVYNIALLRGQFVLSYDTISAALDNHTFAWRADPADPWTGATVEGGHYSIYNLQEYLQTVMGAGSILLRRNSWNGRARVVPLSGHQIRLDKLAPVLGFAVGTVITGATGGSAPVDFTGGVTALNLTCPSLLSGTDTRHDAHNGPGILSTHGLLHTEPYGVADLVANGLCVDLKMASRQVVDEIRLQLTDQNLKPVKLKNSMSTFWLRIRDMGYSSDGMRKTTG